MLLGTPITEEEVASYPQYEGQTITPYILSQVAIQEINRSDDNQGDIQQAAIKIVNGMKGEYGNGVSTLILIYNASGETLNFQDSHDYEGHIWKYPYDASIQNGQWSMVLHVHPGGDTLGSIAAAIYENESKTNDFFIGWDTPYTGNNSAYDECREKGHWKDADQTRWNFMKKKLKDAGSRSDDSSNPPFDINSAIGQNSSPQLMVIIKRTQ